jgi:hypothetical protein
VSVGLHRNDRYGRLATVHAVALTLDADESGPDRVWYVQARTMPSVKCGNEAPVWRALTLYPYHA